MPVTTGKGRGREPMKNLPPRAEDAHQKEALEYYLTHDDDGNRLSRHGENSKRNWYRKQPKGQAIPIPAGPLGDFYRRRAMGS